MLANRMMEKYRYENCVVMALGDGGAVVGAQIAAQLHCALTMLVTAEITLPQESTAVAAITPEGQVSYNSAYSTGELEEMVAENINYMEQEKLVRMHELNELQGTPGTIKKDLLRGHNVIVVSDGLSNGFLVDMAYEYLKPVNIEKLVFAIPFASVSAVDRMHVLADDLYCLSVMAECRETDHYYDNPKLPDHEVVIDTIKNIVLKWQ